MSPPSVSSVTGPPSPGLEEAHLEVRAQPVDELPQARQREAPARRSASTMISSRSTGV